MFHHGHVLVGRRVKDDFRLMLGENRFHARSIHDIGNKRDELLSVTRSDELLFNLKQERLRTLDQKKFGGMVGRDLAT
jgi:hypothetical protein